MSDHRLKRVLAQTRSTPKPTPNPLPERKHNPRVSRFVWMNTESDVSTVRPADQLTRALWTRFRNDYTVVSAPPARLDHEFASVLTPECVHFVSELADFFSADVDAILVHRARQQIDYDAGKLPGFAPRTRALRCADWRVDAIPRALRDLRVTIGDVNLCDTKQVVGAFNSGAQAVQCDFDDGFCPTWENVLLGLYNLNQVVTNTLSYTPTHTNTPITLKKDPALAIFRPRAWNMVERHVMVRGREVAGALFDIGVFLFHCGRQLMRYGRGPYVFLSKMEHYLEARLWNRIFSFCEERIPLQRGCVKACVLIESVPAVFQCHEILYELRKHSFGLNCGMWDYAASFIAKLRHQPSFVLPDRTKYVSMDKLFMTTYRNYVVQVCHHRGVPATGGMAPLACLPDNATPSQKKEWEIRARAVFVGKAKECQLGVDGCLVYDPKLVQGVLDGYAKCGVTKQRPNQLHRQFKPMLEDEKPFLTLPSGSISFTGLRKNITVGVRFIEGWLRGVGHFVLDGCVEDSATAEISRSQVWQWLRHNCLIDNSGDDNNHTAESKTKAKRSMMVTRRLVRRLLREVVTSLTVGYSRTSIEFQRWRTAARVFESVVNMRTFPDFITSYLYNQDIFWQFSDTVWL